MAGARFDGDGLQHRRGLGDVVPTTRSSRLFLIVYAPLAVASFARIVGTLALRPLDEARRAAQRAVLDRFEAGLTAQTLDEVVRGPVVKRLNLSEDDSYCTREEFILLTLVMQGKLTEEDLAECRETFEYLDADGSGYLSMEDLDGGAIGEAAAAHTAPDATSHPACPLPAALDASRQGALPVAPPHMAQARRVTDE